MRFGTGPGAFETLRCPICQQAMCGPPGHAGFPEGAELPAERGYPHTRSFPGSEPDLRPAMGQKAVRGPWHPGRRTRWTAGETPRFPLTWSRRRSQYGDGRTRGARVGRLPDERRSHCRGRFLWRSILGGGHPALRLRGPRLSGSTREPWSPNVSFTSVKAVFDRSHLSSQSMCWPGSALKQACALSRISLCLSPANAWFSRSIIPQDERWRTKSSARSGQRVRRERPAKMINAVPRRA